MKKIEEKEERKIGRKEYVCVDRSWLCVFLSERRKYDYVGAQRECFRLYEDSLAR